MSSRNYPGINIQWPISQLIVTNKKSVETRVYPISNSYLGKEVLLIETPGKTGKFKSRAIAIIKIEKCFKYINKKSFYEDESRHCVEKGSPWEWKDKPKYGWEIKIIKIFEKPIYLKCKTGIIYTKNIFI